MVQVRANKSCDTNVRGTVASVLKRPLENQPSVPPVPATPAGS